MTVSNLFTSNSESKNNASPEFTVRKVFVAVIWSLVWLILIDVTVNILFAMPTSPNVLPSKMQTFFNYGRSVEGKIRSMVGVDKEATAKIAYAGWIMEDDTGKPPMTASAPAQILVAAYGQSFSNQICDALNEIDPRFELRLKAGPGATLSHSYAYYKIDAKHQHADVVVLGILASSLPYMMGPTISTLSFEMAAPYTYPVYFLKDGQLSAHDPVIHSLEELRTALWSNPVLWEEYLKLLRTNSFTYNKWVYDSDLFDYSSLGRLVRRSIGQKHVYDVTSKYWTQDGFKNTDGLLDVANALIADFAADVKAKSQIPYVLLIQDKGYKDHLALAFESQLKQLNIPYLSTHTIAPSTNYRNFISDGHFTPEVTKQIARAFRDDVLSKLDKH